MFEAGPSSRNAALEAATWHERLADAPEDRARRESFAQWRDSDPNHAAEFEAVERALRVAAMAANEPEIRAMRAAAAARAPRRRRWSAQYALAAGFAAVLALTGAVGWHVYQTTPLDPAVYETHTGERKSITLADGSVVSLNTRSRVRIAYTRAERRGVVEAGEAIFEVAKDRDRPFRVAAGGQVVTAHGTMFDVRLGPGRLDVALFEGRIGVRPDAAPRAKETEVRPGQRLTVTGARTQISDIPSIDQMMSWRRGVVIFEDTTLAEAVAEMNRYNEAQIRIGDPSLADLRLSGSFPTTGATAFIEALELYFPLRARWAPDASVVLTARRNEAFAAAG